MVILDKQHFQKERMESLGGFVSIADITSPIHGEDAPIFLACGWSETLDMLKDTLFSIHKIMGRRVLALDYSYLDDTRLADKHFPPNDYLKAQSLIALLEKKGIDQIDVIAHSEGAIITAIAACLRPEKFRKILFISPAGMLQNDNFSYLIFRFLKDTIFELSASFRHKTFLVYTNYIKHSLIYIFRNPIQSTKEAFGISKFKILHLLRRIQDSGVSVIIIQHKEDIVFPVDKVKAMARKAGIKNFYLVEGEHNEIHANPEKFISMIHADGFLNTYE